LYYNNALSKFREIGNPEGISTAQKNIELLYADRRSRAALDKKLETPN
jgi:hypothetical protein